MDKICPYNNGAIKTEWGKERNRKSRNKEVSISTGPTAILEIGHGRDVSRGFGELC